MGCRVRRRGDHPDTATVRANYAAFVLASGRAVPKRPDWNPQRTFPGQKPDE